MTLFSGVFLLVFSIQVYVHVDHPGLRISLQLQPITGKSSTVSLAFANRTACLFVSDKVRSHQQLLVVLRCRWDGGWIPRPSVEQQTKR